MNRRTSPCLPSSIAPLWNILGRQVISPLLFFCASINSCHTCLRSLAPVIFALTVCVAIFIPGTVQDSCLSARSMQQRRVTAGNTNQQKITILWKAHHAEGYRSYAGQTFTIPCTNVVGEESASTRQNRTNRFSSKVTKRALLASCGESEIRPHGICIHSERNQVSCQREAPLLRR